MPILTTCGNLPHLLTIQAFLIPLLPVLHARGSTLRTYHCIRVTSGLHYILSISHTLLRQSLRLSYFTLQLTKMHIGPSRLQFQHYTFMHRDQA